jgi:predicted DNA-binding transcriptional regulator AlpA
MQTYDFTLILSGVPELTDEVCDALFEAGCDDAVLGQREGVTFLDFGRDANSARAAILSAIDAVEGAGIGARVVRVEPDDLVTMAEIARRAGRSRESVRQLAKGWRGPGDFPAPVANLGKRSPIWRWTEVARWLAERGERFTGAREELWTVVPALNAALELRRQSEALPDANQLYESVLRSGERKRRHRKARGRAAT